MADETNEIRRTLEAYLGTLSGLPDIVHENVQYSPTTGTPYITTSFIPTIRTPAVRGRNPQMLYKGVYSFNVRSPVGEGPGEAEGYATALIEAFEAATDINPDTNEYTTVSIETAERGLGLEDDPWYVTPVNIYWYLYK